MRCLGCKAWKNGKCLAGVVPYKSKKEADGVGCNCNTRTIDKRIRERGAADMGMYIPNMNPEQFYNLCKEHGLEIIAIPAADVRPVVRGRWEYIVIGENVKCVCSVCRNYSEEVPKWIYYDGGRVRFNFCPNCGADMREES